MRPESASGATPLGTLRAAFEYTGTPSWIMRTIRQEGIDRALGFRLDLELTGDGYRGGQQATVLDLISGEADLIDTDWIGIGRMRREGMRVAAFHPYGRIMGGLAVDRARVPGGFKDLAGRRIAVVSHRDKTWLLLRACALQAGLGDPAQTVELIETGSKHEVLRLLQAGEADGAVLFWHLVAAALADPCLGLAFDALDGVEALTGAALPTTFFVASDALAQDRPELLRAFARAFDTAVGAMRDDPTLWWAGAAQTIADTQARTLREAWLRRVGLRWPDRLPNRLTDCFETLKAHLGSEPLGLAALPAGTFHPDFLPCEEATA